MSRTYKDRPIHIRNRDFNYELEWEFHHPHESYRVEYVSKWSGELVSYISSYRLQKAGAKKKLKKRQDTEHRWMSTPMHWIHDFMQVPQRAAGTRWEKKALKTPVKDLDTLDKPSVSRKPHMYYW